MKNTENKNTGFMVLVIVLVLIIIGLTSYIAYNKINNSKNDTNTEKNNEELLETGKKLFKKYGDYVYSSSNLNYNNLDNSIKLKMALLNSENKVYNKDFNINSKNITYDGGIILDYYLKVNISDLEKSYKELFGQDKTVNYSDTFGKDLKTGLIYDDFSTSVMISEISNPIGCRKENNEYVCYVFWGDDFETINALQYDHVEMENNQLNIYVNFLTLNQPSEGKLCSDYSCNNIIDNTIYKNEDLNDSNKEKLFEKYKGKTGVYKLVFNKDDSNNWYWEETQIIK